MLLLLLYILNCQRYLTRYLIMSLPVLSVLNQQPEVTFQLGLQSKLLTLAKLLNCSTNRPSDIPLSLSLSLSLSLTALVALPFHVGGTNQPYH